MSSATQPLASLSLTHVHYNPSDPLSHLSALLSLAPQCLLLTYAILIYSTRELEVLLLLAGQLANEATNYILKRLIKQERPSLIRELYEREGGFRGYGMPSSHAQFVGFWGVYVCLFLWCRLRVGGGAEAGRGAGVNGMAVGDKGHKRRVSGGVLKNGPPTASLASPNDETTTDADTDLDSAIASSSSFSGSSSTQPVPASTLYTLQHAHSTLQNLLLTLLTLTLTLSVATSRIYLSYHTPLQVLIGLLFGFIFGTAYFLLISYIRRSGWLDWLLDLPPARLARIRDLVCEEDLVEVGWRVWEEKRRKRIEEGKWRTGEEMGMGMGKRKGGRRKSVRILDPRTGHDAPPAAAGSMTTTTTATSKKRK